jgi:hypothetical protein
MPTEPRRTVRLTISLDLLCDIWDSRKDLTQNLDDRIEQLLKLGIAERKSRKLNPQT